MHSLDSETLWILSSRQVDLCAVPLDDARLHQVVGKRLQLRILRHTEQ